MVLSVCPDMHLFIFFLVKILNSECTIQFDSGAIPEQTRLIIIITIINIIIIIVDVLLLLFLTIFSSSFFFLSREQQLLFSNNERSPNAFLTSSIANEKAYPANVKKLSF